MLIIYFSHNQTKKRPICVVAEIEIIYWSISLKNFSHSFVCVSILLFITCPFVCQKFFPLFFYSLFYYLLISFQLCPWDQRVKNRQWDQFVTFASLRFKCILLYNHSINYNSDKWNCNYDRHLHISTSVFLDDIFVYEIIHISHLIIYSVYTFLNYFVDYALHTQNISFDIMRIYIPDSTIMNFGQIISYTVV